MASFYYTVSKDFPVLSEIEFKSISLFYASFYPV
jgi:hypothetical protein